MFGDCSLNHLSNANSMNYKNTVEGSRVGLPLRRKLVGIPTRFRLQICSIIVFGDALVVEISVSSHHTKRNQKMLLSENYSLSKTNRILQIKYILLFSWTLTITMTIHCQPLRKISKMM